jgi:hypothetical protein
MVDEALGLHVGEMQAEAHVCAAMTNRLRSAQ